MSVVRVACQTIRWRLKMNATEFARAIGVTPQYVSVVELGGKDAGAYLERVERALPLTAKEKGSLVSARRRCALAVNVKELTEPQREIVAALAECIGGLDERRLSAIRDALGVTKPEPVDVPEVFVDIKDLF